MKKLYFLCLSLFMLFGATNALAVDVVTGLGEMVKDLSKLKAGDKVLLYCNGSTDPEASDYGTREAFMREMDDNAIRISRDLQFGSLSSTDFIWTVLSYEQIDEVSYAISFKSPRGNNLPTFIDDIDTYGQWARWMGKTVSEDEGEAGIYTITITEHDSLFYIFDENGVYFNGQDIHTEKGSANFVGWNSPGENSYYRVYLADVEDKNTVHVTMYLNDTFEEEIGYEEFDVVPGDSVFAPEIENYSFLSAIDFNTGDDIEMPLVAGTEDLELGLTYELWPYVTVIVTDEATGEIIFTSEGFVEKGSKFELPTESDMGLGYSIVTEGYDDFTVTEDVVINLVARKDGANLPFVVTTVENGQFAADTKWYTLKVRGSKTLKWSVDDDAILCDATASLSDTVLWAFTGNLQDGFKLYNKARGAEYILWTADGENGTQAFMTPVDAATEPNTFDLDLNNDGYCFKLHGTADACLNDHAGNGILKFWTNGSSPTDVGSRFFFSEITADILEASQFAPYISVLNAQDCVGGYTAETLKDLRDAYTSKDQDACAIAMEELAAADTIAFDMAKSYAIINAYNDFVVYQPGKTYAIKAEADSSLVWTELDEADNAFHFGFKTANDTTSHLVNIKLNLPVKSFRFGQPATLAPWASNNAEDGSTAEGLPAGFYLVKSDAAVAAYRLVHPYGGSIITLAAMTDKIAIASATTAGGKIGTYNTANAGYPNYWRLKPVGAYDAIENVVVAQPGVQKNAIYDLSGRRVEKAVKGIYIMNGKKVYVK